MSSWYYFIGVQNNFIDRNKPGFVIRNQSNFENDFSRNFLRNEIIPKVKEKLNSSLDINLFKFSEIIRESNRIINHLAKDIAEKHIKNTELGLEISDLILLEKNEDIFGITAKKIIEEKFNIIATFNDILHLKTIFNLQVGKKIDLSENLKAIRERNFVLLFKKNINEVDNYEIKLDLDNEIEIYGKTISVTLANKNEVTFSNNKNIEYINGDKIVFPITIRKWIDGDSFNPLGLNGTKTVSDFLTEVKIHSNGKKDQLLLLNANKIIWVVSHRIDESVKLKNDTKRIIKLWVK